MLEVVGFQVVGSIRWEEEKSAACFVELKETWRNFHVLSE